MFKKIMAVVLFLTAGIMAATSYTATIKDGEDCFIQSATPAATPGSLNMLMAGRSSFASRGYTKTLIRFDLSSIANKFNTVTSAKIKLYLFSTDAVVFTNDTLKVFKISAANRTWSPGTGTIIGDSVTGGACYKWLSYDNTNLAPQDPLCPGCPRRFPWASDVALWNNGHGTVASIVGGLSVAGTDYESTPIGTATISSSQKNSFIEITLNVNSFFKDWANAAANNAGFVIDMARVDTSKRDCGTFPSFDHANPDYHPQLEISFSDWTGSVVKSIDYSFPTAGRVSMLIRNNKQVIKEVLWGKSQTAGLQSYNWDARNDQGAIVPDGQYTAKILQTQGLTAEYMGVLGISAPQYEGWMGNHFGPLSLAVDDTVAVYIAGGGEITPSVLKMKPGGTRLWTGNAVSGIPVPIWEGLSSAASDGGKLYLLTTDRLIRVIACDAAPQTYTSFQTGITVTNTLRSGLVNAIDMDVRNGKMVTTSAYSNELQWRTVTTGAVTSKVTVADIAGVALANDGKALVISGNQVKAYVEGSTTPTTIISSGLTFPYRLSVNRNNGDIYVSELGPAGVNYLSTTSPSGQQIKRFNQSGVLQATYGRLGGRVQSGVWQPDSGFRNVLDIAVVSTDSSFWICECTYNNGVRRTSHYNKNGKLIKEWFGGTPYATQSSADPEDPSIIWVDGDPFSLYRVKMNWQTKEWTMLGTYAYADGNNFIEQQIPEGQRWSVRKRNNKTYLARTVPPEILYFDEAADRLRPVSKATHADFVKYCPLINSAPDYAGTGNTRMFSWYDKDGNGAANVGEWTWTPGEIPFGTWFNFQNQKYLGPDKDFNYYPFFPEGPTNWSWGHTWGVGKLTPTWKTVNGVDMPVYDWINGITYVTPEVQAIAQINTVQAKNAFNDSLLFPGRADDYIGDNTEIFAYSEAGAVADDSGNVFCSMYAGNNTKSDHFMAKWDKNGAFQWAVGKKSTTYGVPPSGSIYRPDVILGTTKGCVALADYLGGVNYVWNKDGLYVGNMFDKKHANSASLPTAAWDVCGEQFAGEIFEVKTNTTPGLNKGDVLYFAAGYYSTPVYRITGWDNFVSQTVTLTVSGGQVFSTGIIQQPPVAAPQISGRITMANASVEAVSLTIDRAATVSVVVYSLLGRTVAVLAKGRLEAGVHVLSVKERSLSAGMYFVRASVNGSVLTQRLFVR